MPNKASVDQGFIVQALEFGNALRRAGLTVGSNQLLTWLEAIDLINWWDPEVFYDTAETVLVNRGGDRALFRQIFMDFWLNSRTGNQPQLRPSNQQEAGKLEGGIFGPSRMAEAPAAESEVDRTPEGSRAFYSATEVLRRKDFGEMNETELAEIEQFLADFRLQFASFRSRRYQRGKGQRLDFRSSLRRNLRFGGEWLRWDRRARRRQQRPLVVLADVSGSMERYSRLFLLFVHALTRGYQASVEAFAFGTQLSRITPAFERTNQDRLMAAISELVPDWSGGTRIGHSLETFNLEWAKRTLSRRAVVLLISDGWDRGQPDLLSRQMARLQRTSSALIWLNPLLGSPQYRVKTRGMLAALPFIDHFLPAHNVASLQELGRLMRELSEPGRSVNERYRPGNVRRMAA